MNTQVIQVDYDGLQQVATRFNSAAQQIEQMYQITNRAFQQLENGGWVGRGANAFINEMRGEVFPAVQRLAQALAEADLTTQQIIQILQHADEEAAHPFGGAGTSFGGAVAGAGAGAGIGGAWDSGGFVRQAPGILNNFGDRSFGSSAGSGLANSGIDSWNGGFSGGGYGLPQAWSGSGLSPWAGSTGTNYNDYGIPHDWLSGGSGGGTAVNNWGIPHDWLGDVSTGLDQDVTGNISTPLSGGGAATGGGIGGGLEADTGNAPADREPLMPGGGSGGGNTTPETVIRDPYGTDDGSRDFGSSQPSADSSGRFRYEAVSSNTGSSSSGVEPTVSTTPDSSNVAAPLGGTAETGNNKTTGIPFGIMAASPFMALLGKMVLNKGNEQ